MLLLAFATNDEAEVQKVKELVQDAAASGRSWSPKLLISASLTVTTSQCFPGIYRPPFQEGLGWGSVVSFGAISREITKWGVITTSAEHPVLSTLKCVCREGGEGVTVTLNL